MDFVHCNACFTVPSAEVSKFFITSCGHFFCCTCENEDSDECRLCKKPCKIVQISSDMQNNLKILFSDVGNEFLQILKVTTFQQQNFKLIVNEYLPHLEKKYILLKEAQSKQKEKINELETDLRKYQQNNRLLTEENEQLKRQLWNVMAAHYSGSNNSPSTPACIVAPSTSVFRSQRVSPGSQSNSSVISSGHRPSSRPTMIEALRQTRCNNSSTPLNHHLINKGATPSSTPYVNKRFSYNMRPSFNY